MDGAEQPRHAPAASIPGNGYGTTGADIAKAFKFYSDALVN
jgi:hypothetical protein